MKISPKFYVRKMPALIDGDTRAILLPDGKTMRLFIRHDDSDKDWPARVAVEMSKSELQRLIDELSMIKNQMQN